MIYPLCSRLIHRKYTRNALSDSGAILLLTLSWKGITAGFMTDDESESRIPPVNHGERLADLLADALEGASELTLGQHARFRDTIGLLGAIGDGKLKSSGRIRDNLVELLDSITEEQKGKLSSEALNAVNKCLIVLVEAATRGFTVEPEHRERLSPRRER